MITLTLKRLDHTPFATYGQLLDAENTCWCVTLEKPWVDANADGISDHDVSCIPAGSFPAHRRLSPKRGYDVFELSGVPGRGNIEIHKGNLPKDSEGCILLGSEFGDLNGQHGITGSAAAFERFMDRLRGVDVFTLVVLDPPQGHTP